MSRGFCFCVLSLSGWDRRRLEDILFFFLMCVAVEYGERMSNLRPFRSEAELMEASDVQFRGLDVRDQIAAFNVHPRIGAQVKPGKEGRKVFVLFLCFDREQEG